MRFELKRTTANFKMFNPRLEQNKGNAFDLPFDVTVDDKILSMLAPTVDPEGEDEDLNVELFTKEGQISRPSINPLHINRKPEGAIVTIWDQEGTKNPPLKLRPCSLKDLKAELRTPNQVVLSGKIQYPKYNDKELLRINALTNKSFDLAIEIEQADMFQKEDEKESVKDPKAKSEKKDKKSKK